MNYTDPSNLDDIVEQIKNAQTFEGIYQIVNTVFPNWILKFVPHYCPNYPHIQQNWYHICRQNNLKPAQIIIVNYLSDDKEHRLMNIFLDVFYSSGFVVRLNQHYDICSRCQSFAVPTEYMHRCFVERNIPNIPSVWTPTCYNCNLDNETEKEE